MKEQIHTIPVNDAFLSGDECPFCHMEREAEQRIIRFTLGPSASYMEVDVREQTNRQGFCRDHLKKMYDYSNPLGSALILQTHMDEMLEQLEASRPNAEAPAKRPLLRPKAPQKATPLADWAKQTEHSCYICTRLQSTMDRYYSTFFHMIRDAEFRSRVGASKGFCLHHYFALMAQAEERLPKNQHEWFYETVYTLTRDNLLRVKEDLDWFVQKFDYRNSGADWKNSRDALPRAIQKLRGGYPSDPPFREKGK